MKWGCITEKEFMCVGGLPYSLQSKAVSL